MNQRQVKLEEELFSMMCGYFVSGALLTASKLALADRLRESPHTADELASKIGCHGRSLYRVMRALANVGVFKLDEDQFSLTPLGNLLRSDIPGSQRNKVIEMCSYFEYWGKLTRTVMTGEPPIEDDYDVILTDDERSTGFYEAMDSFYYDNPAPMLGSYDFSGKETVADIGAGSGSQLIAVLKHYPQMKGIMFDLPDIAKRIEETVKAAGLEDRCRVVGGSFFKSIPGGADIYMMRHIIHNWNDEKSVQILCNVRKVVSNKGKVLIIENVIPPPAEIDVTSWRDLSVSDKSFAVWWDLSMFASSDGAERTEEEFGDLLVKAGLKLTRVVPTSIDVSVVEGIKAQLS